MEYIFGAIFIGALVLSYYLKNVSIDTNQTFGVPLHRITLHQPSGVPILVFDCIEHLHSYHGAQVKGLFKETGDRRLLAGLVKSYNRGDRLVSEKVDVHTIATLLGIFVRQLPDTLIGDVDPLIDMQRKYSDDDDSWKQEMIHHFQSLPSTQQATLATIFDFLHEMNVLESINQTNVGKLSYIWCGYFRLDQHQNHKTIMKVIARCIIDAPSLFNAQ